MDKVKKACTSWEEVFRLRQNQRVKALRIGLINSGDEALIQMQRQLSDAQLLRVMELHNVGAV